MSNQQHENFGHLLVTLRKKAGIQQQAELAQLLQVSQQTVSRWENGESRPRDKQLPQLAAMFDVSIAELRMAAGYIPSVVATFDAPFPVDALSPESFENFCTHFVAARYPDAKVSRVGGRGHTQDGIDIQAIYPNGKIYTYQCKREKRFGPKQVQDAVEKQTVFADEKYLLLSRVASPQTRQAVIEQPGWTLWDKDDLSREIRQHLSKDHQRRLVDIFFKNQRYALLGETEAGPWQTGKEFFAPYEESTYAFNHNWTLVGRGLERSRLAINLADLEQSIHFLVGPAGSGKSRLIKQAISDFEQVYPSIGVHFLMPGEGVSAKSLEDLGNSEQLLVVDDAHDRDHDDLRILFHWAASKSFVRLLLATRPYELGAIKALTSQFGLSVKDEQIVRLEPLSLEHASELAKQVLEQFGGEPEIAKDIAEATRDCPLFTVIAAEIVTSSHGILELSKNDEKFRNQLLPKFRDILTGHIGTAEESEKIRGLLHILALLQPFHPEDQTLKQIANDVASIPDHTFSRLMRLLEEGGVIFRRGGKYRLSPDLLADYLIDEACIGADGKSTYYAERIFDQTSDGKLLTNLVLNLGKLDWRLMDGRPTSSPLMDGIWAKLQPTEDYGDVHLDAIRAVAYFQPDRTLKLVEKLIRDKRYFRALPEILQRVSYGADQQLMMRTCDALWELRKHGDRPNAEQTLSGLAAFGPGKPSEFSDWVVDFVVCLLGDPNSWHDTTPPLNLFEGVLQTEGHSTESTGREFRMKPYFIKPEVVGPIRKKAIDAVISLLSSPQKAVAVAAAKFLPVCMRYPMGLFGMHIPEENRAAWTAEFNSTLEQVHAVMSSNQIDVLVKLHIARAVDRYTRFEQSTADRAQQIVHSIPATTEILALCAFMGYGEMLKAHGYEIGEYGNDFSDGIIEEIASEHSDPTDLCKFIEENLQRLLEADNDGLGLAQVAIWNLVLRTKGLAYAMLQQTLAQPSALIARFSYIPLSRLLHEDHGRAIECAKAMVPTPELYIGVLRAFGMYAPTGGNYDQDDLQLIEQMVTSPDLAILMSATDVLRSVANTNSPLALKLLLRMPLDINSRLTDSALMLFHHHHGIQFSELDAESVGVLLEKLRHLEQLDGYSIDTFLSEMSLNYPVETASFFLERLELSGETDELSMRPCNFGPYIQVPLKFQQTTVFPQLLTLFRSVVASKQRSWSYNYRLGEVFSAMFGAYEGMVLSFISDWTDSAEEHEMDGLAHLMQEANTDFVFRHSDIARRFIARASQFSPQTQSKVESALFNSAISGVRSSIPGEPSSTDLYIRDESERILRNMSRFDLSRDLYEGLLEHAEQSIQQAKRMKESFVE